MGVKRFDLIESIGGEGWMEEASLGEYVKAADYDALAEKLRETELRLRMYGGHTANCAYHLSHYKGPVSQCDCMWTDLVPTVFAAQREVAK